MPLITTLAVATTGIFAGVQAIRYRRKIKQPLLQAFAPPAEPPQDAALEELDDDERKHVDHYLAVSAASLGVAVAGAVVPVPLGIVAGAGVVYASVPLIVDVFRGLKERRLKVTVIDASATLGLVAGHFYISGAVACLLYFGGQKLMMLSEDRSRNSLINVFGEQPNTVYVLNDDVEVEIPFEQLQAGDTVVVETGQVIPVDGLIVKGVASIDQHMLTGEAQPIEKGVGDPVFAATVVLSGRIQIAAQQTGSATVAATIGQVLEQTIDYRTITEIRSQQLAQQSVVPLLGLSGVALASMGPAGATAVLNSFYNDSLRLSSPLTMLNYLNIASKAGVLVKDGRVLELLSTVDTVVFDKTGTLTQEEPHIGRIHTFHNWDADDLLRHTAAVEAKQAHPIARAIVAAAEQRRLTLPALDDAAYKLGYGIEATIGDLHFRIGSARFMVMSGIELLDAAAARQAGPDAQTVSLVYVAVNGRLAGVIELHPTLRPEAAAVVAALQQRGLETVIISGDHDRPTATLADVVGIDRYFAEVLPQDKAALVRQLQEEGRRVCFVGDGINDAIALKQATVSISLSGATTVATDTAQAVLMDGTLNHLPALFEIGARFDGNMRGNIAAAIGPAVASLGGIFFFGTRIPLAIFMYNVSVAASLLNAMVPAWQKHRFNLPEATDGPEET